MIKKILSIVIGCVTLISFNASAQTVSGEQDYSSGFSGIEVSDYFNAKVKVADYYGVEWTVEEDLKNHMHVYVRGDVLVATVDRKSLDSETKKKYSGKKAANALLSVTIYAPTISTVTATDNAVVDLTDINIKTDNLVVTLDDNAKINGLTAETSALTISASKKSIVENSNIKADNLSINTMNSAVVRVNQTSKNVSLQVNGTSDLYVIGNSETTEVSALNSSKLRLEGSTITLNLTASGKEIHAENFSVNDAIVYGSNACKAYINVSETLSLELKGGCLISYGGSPAVDIVNIQNSSVSRMTL